MRKLLTLLMAIVLAFSFTLVGCGGGNGGNGGDDSDDSGSGGKTTIIFAGRGSIDEENNYTRFIREFNDANPDIYVTPQWSADEASYGNYLKGLIGSSGMPEVFMMDDRDFLAYASGGVLLNIKSYVTQDELDSMYETAYSKYYYNSKANALGDTNGGLYGLPKDQGPYTLVYNKKLIKEICELLKIPVEYPSATEPMTFVTFVDYCKKLVNGAKAANATKYANLYGIGAYELEAAVYSNNADFFNEGATKSRITEQNFIDAVQWIADLYLEHRIMPDAGSQANNNSYQRFTSGQSLFCFAGPWDCTNFWKELTFEWDICPAVVGTAEGAVSTAWVGSMAYSVSGTIRNSKKKEAAVKFAKYLSMSLDSQRTQYSIGQAIPNLKSLEEEYCNDTQGLIGNKNGPEHRSVWIDIVNGTSETDKVTGKTRACYYTYGSDWLTALTETFSTQGLWSTKNKAESIIKGFNKQFQAYLDDYQDQM